MAVTDQGEHPKLLERNGLSVSLIFLDSTVLHKLVLLLEYHLSGIVTWLVYGPSFKPFVNFEIF